MTAAGNAKRDKENGAIIRECLDGARTHLRIGWWYGEPVIGAIRFLGMVSDLHGSVCTCCPQRPEDAA